MKITCKDGVEREFIWQPYKGFFCMECHRFPDGYPMNSDDAMKHVCKQLKEGIISQPESPEA